MSGSELALLGGAPLRDPDKAWPTWPLHDEREREVLLAVLESGNWWYGEQVEKFEQEFAAFQGAKHCISCTSGTTALEICLQTLGIGPGDKVIVPPFTFFATASAVARLGATPVFVDVDDSWNLDAKLVEEAASAEGVRAIMPVHFGGRTADMKAINAVAAKHDLRVVEDACHSWGAQQDGRGTGTFGDCGVFSFQASKNMTAGEGGAIVTNDDDLARDLRSMTHSGRMPEKPWYEHYLFGTNARITEYAAALLRVQLSRMEEHNATRARNAALLDEHLGAIEGLTPQPADPTQNKRTYHIYCLRVDPKRFGCARDRVVEAILAEGLYIGAGYPLPLYKQPVFKATGDYEDVCCPVCEDLCYRSAMWLNHRLLLGSEDDMRDVVAIFQKVKERAGELA